MLKIGSILIFLLINSIGCFALDELRLDIVYNNGVLESRLMHSDNVWTGFEEVKMNDRHYYYASDTSRKVDFWRIEMLEVRITGISKKEILNLSEIEEVRRLKIPAIGSLVINIEGFKGRVDIDLENWSQYTSWKYLNTITSFGVDAPDYSNVGVNLDALRIFDLYSLRVPKSVGAVLDAFPNLGILHARGVLTAFTHQLYLYDELFDLQEYDPIYTNAFETLHAERYYMFQCLNKPIRWEIPMPLFGYMDELFNVTEASRNGIEDGEFVIYENDYPEFTGKTIENDTLLHGYKKEGKHVGIHTFKVHESYEKSDFEKYHLDFSNPQRPTFDKDGHWQFNYLNGNVAIEGNLRNRKKIGDWKFYSESGVLRTTKTFDNDTLRRSITRLELHGNELESRTYFVSEYEIYQSMYFSQDNKVRLNALYHDGFGTPYFYSEYEVVEFREFGQKYGKSYSLGTDGYERMIRKGIIDLLYPEYVGKELPFRVE